MQRIKPVLRRIPSIWRQNFYCAAPRWNTAAVLVSLLVAGSFNSAFGQSLHQCDSMPSLAKISERTVDLTFAGINSAQSITIFPDGRFHLERRFQQLPSSSAMLTIFESSLTRAQLQDLEGILTQVVTRHIPDYMAPNTSMGNQFRMFLLTMPNGDEHKTVGYWTWPYEEQENPLNATPSDTKKVWAQTEDELRPALEWFHRILSLPMSPTTDGKSRWCTTDSSGVFNNDAVGLYQATSSFLYSKLDCEALP